MRKSHTLFLFSLSGICLPLYGAADTEFRFVAADSYVTEQNFVNPILQNFTDFSAPPSVSITGENDSLNSASADGSGNTYSLSADSLILNSYTEVLGFDSCSNGLLVKDPSSFKTGDTVLIAQMQGALIDSSDSPGFGTVSDYKNAGNYEFNYVAGIAGNILKLKNLLLRKYDIPQGKVQLVRVPYFESLTITTPLTCLPWDGGKGGIVAIQVKGTLDLEQNIDVTARGFTGGNSPNTGSTTLYCFYNGYTYAKGNLAAAAKGNGISQIGDNISWGKGAPANGGGGGSGHNSGGGGGANGGDGGFGGFQLLTCGNSPFDNRGLGGHALVYNNTENRIYLGGGGGSGHVDNRGGSNMEGGNGGGIVILNAAAITTNNFSILAKGGAANQCSFSNFSDCHDGSGGGGGGGTVLFEYNTITAPLNIDVSGGKGGDLIIYNPVAGADKIGPGGGGGAGVVWLNSAALPPNLNIKNSGGQNGVILQNNNDPWGTTPGQSGLLLFNLKTITDIQPFKKNIDSVRIDQTPTACTKVQFDAKSFTNFSPVNSWNWDLGDGSKSTASTFSHQYLTGGVYLIHLTGMDQNNCMDSATLTIVLDTLKADAGTDTVICPGAKALLHGTGGTQFSWTPAGLLDNSALANPAATIQSDTRFYLTVSNILGCQSIDSVAVTLLTKPVFHAPDTFNACKGQTGILHGNNDASYLYKWTPATNLDDPSSADPHILTSTSTIYQLSITEQKCGYDTTFNVVVNVSLPPVIQVTKSNDIDCQNPSASLKASGAQSYTWLPKSGVTNAGIADPVTTIDTTTTFTVTGTDSNGCIASDTISVNVSAKGKTSFVVPNAFTPNGDGHNDCFGIRKWGNVKLDEFSVYNRWGERIFHTTNPSACWDGRFNGKMQDTGGYVYILKAQSFCGPITRTGMVMLIR